MNKLTINRVISAIITIALLSSSLVGCGGYINNAIQEKRANDTVSRAQNSCNEVLPNITYKDAYEHFFSEPQWRGFTTLDNHEIVEFTGNCTYKDEQALAYIEFVEGQDGTFSANYARLTIRGERIELAKDEMMFLMLSVVTAKETNVGGTSICSKVPLIESLPPIAAISRPFCAMNAPNSAARGLPQRLPSFMGFSKYSWKER